MRVEEKGHIYALDWLDGEPINDRNLLIFVNREDGDKHPGTQTQEVIRALIDRTLHCDGCLRWEGNDLIVQHLRMALALHEARALMRKAEKGLYRPENVLTDKDGHFKLTLKKVDLGL